jgi:Trk-type K+ transport system membrane component
VQSFNPHVSYLDSIFLSVSAVTSTGLTTISMLDLSRESFVVIGNLINCGGSLLLPLGSLIYRRIVYNRMKKKFSKRITPQMIEDCPILSEYDLQNKAIGTMIRIILCYILGWYCFGFLFLTGALHLSAIEPELVQRDWNNAHAGTFLTISAFNNAGFSLSSNSVYFLQNNPIGYLLLSLLIVVGNTMAPVCYRLWFYIELKWRIYMCWDTQPIRFILDNPRKISVNTLPTREVIFLFITTTTLNILQYVFYLASCLNRTEALQIANQTTLAGMGFFQTISTRNAGLQIMDLRTMNQGMLLVYGIAMYLSGAPFMTALYASEDSADNAARKSLEHLQSEYPDSDDDDYDEYYEYDDDNGVDEDKENGDSTDTRASALVVEECLNKKSSSISSVAHMVHTNASVVSQAAGEHENKNKEQLICLSSEMCVSIEENEVQFGQVLKCHSSARDEIEVSMEEHDIHNPSQTLSSAAAAVLVASDSDSNEKKEAGIESGQPVSSTTTTTTRTRERKRSRRKSIGTITPTGVDTVGCDGTVDVPNRQAHTDPASASPGKSFNANGKQGLSSIQETRPPFTYVSAINRDKRRGTSSQKKHSNFFALIKSSLLLEPDLSKLSPHEIIARNMKNNSLSHLTGGHTVGNMKRRSVSGKRPSLTTFDLRFSNKGPVADNRNKDSDSDNNDIGASNKERYNNASIGVVSRILTPPVDSTEDGLDTQMSIEEQVSRIIRHNSIEILNKRKYEIQNRFIETFIMKHSFFIGLGVIVCAFSEDGFMSKYPEIINLWYIIFEVVSAYGNVGLSLNEPSKNRSLSGSFGFVGKLTIVLIMMLGKHRGLPKEQDAVIDFTFQRLKRHIKKKYQEQQQKRIKPRKSHRVSSSSSSESSEDPNDVQSRSKGNVNNIVNNDGNDKAKEDNLSDLEAGQAQSRASIVEDIRRTAKQFTSRVYPT